MTFKIASDELGPYSADGFAAAVAARIEVLREYDAHEVVVRQHAADENMPVAERWVTLAVPQSDLDAAIRVTENTDGTHTFEPDYEIVPPALDKRKAALFAQVNEAERAALLAVLPQGKVRAYQFREADIRSADQARVIAEYAKGSTGISNIEQFHIASRPEADTRFLEEQAAREDQRNEIQRWGANLHSEIEDLTEATVDAFEVKPFND